MGFQSGRRNRFVVDQIRWKRSPMYFNRMLELSPLPFLGQCGSTDLICCIRGWVISGVQSEKLVCFASCQVQAGRKIFTNCLSYWIIVVGNRMNIKMSFASRQLRTVCSDDNAKFVKKQSGRKCQVTSLNAYMLSWLMTNTISASVTYTINLCDTSHAWEM